MQDFFHLLFYYKSHDIYSTDVSKQDRLEMTSKPSVIFEPAPCFLYFFWISLNSYLALFKYTDLLVKIKEIIFANYNFLELPYAVTLVRIEKAHGHIM